MFCKILQSSAARSNVAMSLEGIYYILSLKAEIMFSTEYNLWQHLQLSSKMMRTIILTQLWRLTFEDSILLRIYPALKEDDVHNYLDSASKEIFEDSILLRISKGRLWEYLSCLSFNRKSEDSTLPMIYPALREDYENKYLISAEKEIFEHSTLLRTSSALKEHDENNYLNSSLKETFEDLKSFL